MSASADARSVVDGLFETVDGGIRLIGTRCKSCGTAYFPQAVSCRNPDCREKAVERMLLPERGTVHSYTIQRYRPPPAFRMDDWQPYALALVDLGEGLLVMGMMTGVALDAVAIGQPVRLVEGTLHAEAEGRVTTYMFAPDAERGAR